MIGEQVPTLASVLDVLTDGFADINTRLVVVLPVGSFLVTEDQLNAIPHRVIRLNGGKPHAVFVLDRHAVERQVIARWLVRSDLFGVDSVEAP